MKTSAADFGTRRDRRAFQHFVALFLCAGGTVFSYPVQAQLTPDNTLDAESSVVTPLDALSDRIDGGAARGSNLFHSFQDFNVGDGRSVYFANPAGIGNILTRVTGSNISEIFGRLGVLGDANLFLLNPNGIVFGPNATLDISGSFVASTAEGIWLGSSGFFSATDPQGSQLLSIQPGALFTNALQNHQAAINNQGNLAVGAGQTLRLQAGVVTSSGSLTAAGGRVELLGDRVGLFDNASIDVSSPTGGGTVLIGGDFQGGGNIPTASRTFVGEGVTLNANALTQGDGGTVIVWADEINRFAGTINARGGANGGNGGFVEVSGKDSLVFRGNIDATALNGNPGSILFDPRNITIAAGGADPINPNDAFAENAGADVTFDAAIVNALAGIVTLQANNDITVNQAINSPTITDLTLQAGRSIAINQGITLNNGSLNLVANETVANGVVDAFRDPGAASITMAAGTTIDATQGINFTLSTGAGLTNNAGGDITLGNLQSGPGDVVVDNQVAGGNILLDNARVETTAAGAAIAGNINFTGNAVNLTNGATIRSRTNGSGFSGNIDIQATDAIALDNSTIENTTSGAGAASSINLNSRTLTLTNNSRLNASTLGSGDAGQINIQTTESVVVDNSNIASNVGSGTNNTATGAAGIVSVNAGSLSVTNNGLLAVSTFGQNDAGQMNLQIADTIVFDSGGRAISNVEAGAVGNGGGVQIRGRTLSVTGGSAIEANTFALGNAGFIDIQTTDAVTVEGSGSAIRSDVEAGAVGDGGGIMVNAGSLSVTNSGLLAVSTFGQGSAGGMSLQASDSVTFSGGSQAVSTVEAGAVGDGGGIQIRGRTLSVTGNSIIDASTSGQGNAGFIDIQTTDAVTVEGSGSAIRSDVEAVAVGDGGGIMVNAGSLSVTNNGLLAVSTFGQGSAGGMSLQASDSVTFSGGGKALSNVEAGAVGNGGGIQIRGRTLSVTGGSGVEANTLGQGNAGFINIQTTDAVAVDGSDSVIRSDVETGAVGDGGGVQVNAGSLSVTNNGLFAVSTFGQGSAGGMSLQASDFITFSGGGRAISNVEAGAVGNGGSIQIRGRTLSVTSNSIIDASTSGQGNAGFIDIQTTDSVVVDGFNSVIRSDVERGAVGDGGQITVNTGTLAVTNGGTFAVSTLGQGNAGAMSFRASESITFSGSTQALSDVVEGAAGNGGNIDMVAPVMSFRGDTNLSASTRSLGNAGQISLSGDRISFDDATLFVRIAEGGTVQARTDINVSANTLSLANGTEISASTNGRGDAGNVTLSGDIISLDRSTVSSAVGSQGVGNGGGVNLNAQVLSLTNEARLSANTSGQGNAGSVRLTGDTIDLQGSTVSSAVNAGGVGNGGNVSFQARSLSVTDSKASSSSAGQGNAGRVFVAADTTNITNNSSFSSAIEAGGVGNGDNVRIETRTFSLSNGSTITGSTDGRGNAGNIFISVAETATLNNATILNQATEDSVGDGGNLRFGAREIFMTDSRISADNRGTGVAGNLQVETQGNLRLERSQITAETQSGDGGNIDLQVGNVLLMRDRSLISTTAGQSGSGGDGGNIDIAANFIIGPPIENSDITANAFEGSGGSINITTNGIYGLEFRPQLTPLSDITASSRFGASGTVNFNLLSFRVEQGLNQLPQNLVDAESLVGQNACALDNGKIAGGSSLTLIGRGGLPPNPGDSAAPIAGTVSWATRPSGGSPVVMRSRSNGNEGSHPQEIRQAQGWQVAADGTVELTAEVPAVTAYNSGFDHPNCQTGTATQ